MHRHLYQKHSPFSMNLQQEVRRYLEEDFFFGVTNLASSLFLVNVIRPLCCVPYYVAGY